MKNTPDSEMSIYTIIRQQLVNSKTYKSQKLHEQVEELSCRLCPEKQETISHVLSGCSYIADHFTKLDMTKCFAVYHALLQKYGFDESDYSSTCYIQSHPQPGKESNEAKML